MRDSNSVLVLASRLAPLYQHSRRIALSACASHFVRLLLRTAGLVVLVIVVSTGCSKTRNTARDYDEYVSNNPTELELTSIDVNAKYRFTQRTEDHRYEFRAYSVGIGNLWVVELGKMLEVTLQSDKMQSAFRSLDPIAGRPYNDPYVLTFDLESYEFDEYRARLALAIAAEKGSIEVLRRTYRSEGDGQAVQMWLAGAFGMELAIYQSTQAALDEVIAQFLVDLEDATDPQRSGNKDEGAHQSLEQDGEKASHP